MTITTFNRHSPLHDEIEARKAAIASDAAFVKALARAAKRGKEHACAGTFVETKPFRGRRIDAAPARSVFSSPAAMCVS